MRIYLAGPMTGIPDYNYPAFHRTAYAWRAFGWDVLDPSTKFGGRTDLPYEVYINHSLIDLIACDVVAVLPGWESSRGAQLEVHYARVVGKPVVRADHPRGSLEGCVRAEGEDVRASEAEL